jgi:hypothetical protein
VSAVTDQGPARPNAVLEVTRELVDDVVAFIRTRLDEMEQRAKAVAQLLAGFDRQSPTHRLPLDPLREYALSHSPRQELSDAAAMRRLLDHLLFFDGLFVKTVSRDVEALVTLASRWKWHPDFQELLRRHARPIDAPAPPPPARGKTNA